MTREKGEEEMESGQEVNLELELVSERQVELTDSGESTEPCRDKPLQCHNRLIFFTVSLSIMNFFTILPSPFLASQVTSLERQFSINSTELGALMSANDIGFLLLVLVIAHFAKDAHCPRILAVATIVFGLSSIVIGMLNFIKPTSLQELAITANTSLGPGGGGSEDRYLCLPGTLNTTSLQRFCASKRGDDSNSGGDSKGGLIIVFGLMLGIQGVCKGTRSPLGTAYIDNNVPHRSKTGFHVGLMLTVMLFAPPVGFALGGFIGRIPVDLSDITLSSRDPRWIGAWWLGFLVSGALTILAGLPLFLFPKRMPNARPVVDETELTQSAEEKKATGMEDKDMDEETTAGVVDAKTADVMDKTTAEGKQQKTADVMHEKTEDVLDDKTADVMQADDDSTKNKPTAATEDESESENEGLQRAKIGNGEATKTMMGNGVGTTDTFEKGERLAKMGNGEEKACAEKQNGEVCKDGAEEGERCEHKASVVEMEFMDHEPKKSVSKLAIPATVKDLPLSLLRLLQNPVYAVLVLAFSAQMFAIIGYSSFLIKFVERQFGLPPWLSAYVFGLSNLVCSGLGTFIGGVLVSRGNLTRRGCLRWTLIGGSISVALTAVTLGLGCDGETMVGLDRRQYALDDGLTACGCDFDQYLPVCDGTRTFLSPCHAGCSRAANTTHFDDCSGAATGHVTAGVCSPGCHLMIPFILVQVLASAFGATMITPLYVTVLRTSSEKDKTLGMGLLSFFISILGFIPAPIVYGAVIDSTCLIWTRSCRTGSGPCALYDVTRLRHNYIGLETGGKALALCFFALALLLLTWQVRTGRTKDDPPGEKEDKVKKPSVCDEKQGEMGLPMEEMAEKSEDTLQQHGGAESDLDGGNSDGDGLSQENQTVKG